MAVVTAPIEAEFLNIKTEGMTQRISVNGIHLNVLDVGSGPPVLLLHGFPDTHRVWRHQVPALLNAGFRVIAPDLRGFGESDRPEGVNAYAMPTIVQDIVALLDQLGLPKVHLVCHDFGAAAGWVLAAFHSSRIDRMAALSVGHVNAMRLSGLDQRAMSWYMLLFQFEGLAEELLRADGWSFLRNWGRHHQEADHWIEELSKPGALTAALNWYRANQHPSRLLAPPELIPTVSSPVLSLWSSNDPYLGEAQVVRTREFVTGPWQYVRIEGAGHWLQLDRPEIVNRALVDFLTERSASSASGTPS